MKKYVLLCVVLALAILLAVPAVATAASGSGNGFDQYGYNYQARIFNGTNADLYMAYFANLGQSVTYADAEAALGVYVNDQLVMKWNAEWARGLAEKWSNPPYAAWEDNEWNGKEAGGSGQVWHYKVIWVGDYTADPSLVPSGAYGIWGQFAVIMDQGQDPNEGPGHFWFAHATPTGYGQVN